MTTVLHKEALEYFLQGEGVTLSSSKQEREESVPRMKKFPFWIFPQRRSCNAYFQMIDLQILEYTPTEICTDISLLVVEVVAWCVGFVIC